MTLLAVFIGQPLLALIPAAAFLGLHRASGRRPALAAAVAWFLYTGYEYAMHRRWMCTGECNIRVDLLLIYPVLTVLSAVATISALAAIVRRRRALEP